MSTPVSRPVIKSKIPRPVQSRPISSEEISTNIYVQKSTDDGEARARSDMKSQRKKTRSVMLKKAYTEIKVQRKTEWAAKAKSDIKDAKKETSHKNEATCRRRILDDTRTKSNQQAEFNDIPFEPSKQALESILNNQGIVAGVNVRESTIQSGKRSSVYYLPPPTQTSLLKSHAEYKQNMRALQERLRQLNIATPSMKKQEEKLPSTPNQSSRPSNIYYKIKPLNMDKKEKNIPSMSTSERKVLASKNPEINHQSTSNSSLFPRSTPGKENTVNTASSFSGRKLEPLLETALPVSDTKSGEHKESRDNLNSTPATESEPVYASSLSSLGHCDSNSGSVVKDDHYRMSFQTESISSAKQISHQCNSMPLIPLSLLITPTPPRSLVSEILYSSSFTPSTPKYSSVLATDTLSSWALQDIVSTPKCVHSTYNFCSERSGVLMKDNFCYDHQAVRFHQPDRSINCSYSHSYPYHVKVPSDANVQTIATPQHTLRAPNLSSCLKTTGIVSATKSTDLTKLHCGSAASCAKKLRWADTSSS